ncbi:MAG: Transposase IS116/IS110/IS902 family protein [uncultured bacterium]|nr:MAG: Transposase IS116/IS110/IS902 family protein [uncultured bacterium]
MLNMSKFLNSPSVGIDVSAEFSMVSILSPDGSKLRKPFKIIHDSDGYNYLATEIKKVEEAFSMKVPVFMESTGVYHLTLFYFMKNQGFDVFVINPLITNSNKIRE